MATACGATNYPTDSDYMTRASLINFRAAPWTVATWANPSGLAGTYGGVISNRDIGQNAVIMRHNSKLGYWDGGTFNDGTTTMSTGTWYFAATTWDGTSGSAGTVRFYMGTGVDSISQEQTTSEFWTVSTGDVSIAAYSTADSNAWDGALCYTQIYNRVLTIEELKEISVNPYAVIDSILVQYPQNSTTEEADYSGNGNTATVVGTPTVNKDSPPIFLLGGQ